MLRFFRSIRQNLLNENKTAKYFKYAIGEFLLIVAGILVALQIQNWNEGRLDRLKEAEYMQNLLVEMQAAKEEFLEDRKRQEAVSNALESLLVQFENRSASDAEIIEWIQEFSIRIFAFIPPSSVLDDLTSSGNMQLFTSNELRYALNSYSQKKEQIRYADELRISRMYEQVRPFLNKHMNRFRETQRPGTVDQLLASQEFENLISEYSRSLTGAAYEVWTTQLGTTIDHIIALLEVGPRSQPWVLGGAKRNNFWTEGNEGNKGGRIEFRFLCYLL